MIGSATVFPPLINPLPSRECLIEPDQFHRASHIGNTNIDGAVSGVGMGVLNCSNQKQKMLFKISEDLTLLDFWDRDNTNTDYGVH